jgi:hypothetical protein
LIKDERVARERERERYTERDRDREKDKDKDRGGKSTFQVLYVKKIDVNNVWLGAADRSVGKNGAKEK